MMKSIKTICLVGATAFLTACGWHFDNGAAVPAELKTMALESSDPYSEMSMAMRKQLLSNNVNLVPAKQGVPVLRLNKQTSSDKVASVFKQGREAEKVLTLDERDVIWNDMREQAARQLLNKMAALQHQVQGK